MADITKTRTELIERAATELGALPSGGELDDDERETIDNLVDPLRDRLSADGVVEIGDLEAIESKYFIPLAMLLANDAAPSFGQAYSLDKKNEFERQLRRLSATRPTYETLRATYY